MCLCVCVLSIFPFFNIINRGSIYFGGPPKSDIVINKAHDPLPFILLPCGYDNKKVRVRVRIKVRVRVRVRFKLRVRVKVRVKVKVRVRVRIKVRVRVKVKVRVRVR